MQEVYFLASLKRSIPKIEIEKEEDAPIKHVYGETDNWGEEDEYVIIRRDGIINGDYSWYCIFEDGKVLRFTIESAKQYLKTWRDDSGKPMRDESGDGKRFLEQVV